MKTTCRPDGRLRATISLFGVAVMLLASFAPAAARHEAAAGDGPLPVFGYLALEEARAELQASAPSSIRSADASVSTIPRSNAWEPSIKVSGPPDRQIISEYDEWIGPDGTIIAGWISVQGGVGCGFSVSTDEGKTWGAPYYATGAQGGGDPVVVPDASKPGEFYLTCIVDALSAGQGKNVWAYSADAGKSWTNWDRVSNWPSGGAYDHIMDVADNGKIIEIWNNGDGNTRVRKSADGAKSWTGNSQISSGMPSCIEFDKGKNKVWVVSGHGPIGSGNSQATTSSDYGGTWAGAKDVGIRAGARWDCDFDKNSGDFYAITMTTSEVTVIHSADGQAWDKNSVASGSFGSWSDGQRTWPPWAGLAVSPDGTVHAGWISNEGGYFEQYYAKSTDKGKTWSAKEKVSDQAKPTCTVGSSSCRTAHYGHGLVVTKSGAPCIGWALPVANAIEYRSSCNRSGGGGGGGIARVDITPASATITADQTQQFAAKAVDSTGKQVNTTFTWTASGGSVDTNGLYTPQKTGTFTVDATAVGGTKGSAQVTVDHGAQVGLAVSPANPTIAADQTLKFSLDAVDAKGNGWPVSGPTWSITGGAGGGNIDATGLYNPQKVGTYTVEGTDPASSGKASTQVTVTPGAPTSVSVTPGSAGITVDQTQQFAASAADSKGNPITAGATWGASGGQVSSAGVYTPDKVGTFTVTATIQSKAGTASIKVDPGKLATIAVTPDKKSTTADATLQFSAKGADAKGNDIPLSPSWSVSGGADGGSVDSSGLYTPQKVGTYEVSASDGGVTGRVSVTVTPGKVAKVTVDQAEKTAEKGQTVTFTAAAEDSKGNAITATPRWELVGDQIGSLDQSGKLVVRSAGEATVKATVTSGGATVSGEAKVNVAGGALDFKSGGQLPLILGLIAVIVIAAIAAAAVAASRRRKRRAASQQYPLGQSGYGPVPPEWQMQPGGDRPVPDFGSLPPQQGYGPGGPGMPPQGG